jgi:hypothetical protein
MSRSSSVAGAAVGNSTARRGASAWSDWESREGPCPAPARAEQRAVSSSHEVTRSVI